MTRYALVLAAHGSRHEPAVNEQIRQLARELSEFLPFDEVAVAFHQGSPAFSEVLDTLRSTDITVIPYMTSAGYYCDTVLPRELARNRRYPHIRVRITEPVGANSTIPCLIAQRVYELIEQFRIIPLESDFTLAIVGHGTARHQNSRNTTLQIVHTLQEDDAFGQVIALFLDDDPPLERLYDLATGHDVIVLPFLIAPGPHAISDIPRRLGMNIEGKSGPPFVDTVKDHLVICDRPFGAGADLVEVIMVLGCRIEDADPATVRNL